MSLRPFALLYALSGIAGLLIMGAMLVIIACNLVGLTGLEITPVPLVIAAVVMLSSKMVANQLARSSERG